MLPSEAMYPYTAKVARERGELELWRANFRTNCACAGAIELAIRKGFDGMHLWTDCAKSVIDQYGYKRVGFVLANTLQEQSYDGRYHENNKKWSRTIFIPEDGGHRHTFLINSHPAVLDGFVQWCKQVIGLCLTAFLQATILVAGLMVFKDHALLGLGLMLSAGEIPRIAGAFGLDTTTKANLTSAVYTAQSAVNIARTVAAK